MKTKKFYFLIPYLFILISAVHSQNIDQRWQTSAFAYLQNEQYSFRTEGEKSFHAINTKNKLGVHVTPVGYSVSRDKLAANFMVKSVAGEKVNGDQLRHVENTAATLRYHYPAHTIEYKNSEEGLRQNFILSEKGRSASVLLQVISSLQSELVNDRLVLKDKNGKERFYYDGLKVWDANGKLLDASMQLKGDELAINVNDKNAVYPITIDPLNHTPEWTTSADDILTNLVGNLAVDAIYGFTVAGLGDVNGDGFDDVAVSAPGMADIISGSGTLTSVGAVFVYLGSLTGLPTTPSHVLQPTTAVTGALFGFSVTGGDVTGDGINDIIVGAPLDRVQATISGEPNAQIGKVYIYRGGATLTGQNPTPLLNINLDGALLGSLTVTLNPLFGFSVAVADDMNGDGKGEIVVGAPTYARLQGASAIKTGGAFVYLSNPSNTFTTVNSLAPPTGSLLGLSSTLQTILGPVVWNTLVLLGVDDLLDGQIEGLLFGYSVDGTGDYNNDGNKDIVVGAPAGVNLGSLSAVLNGQILGGSAYVFGGTGTGVNTSSLARLQATSTGLLSNAANLFGYSVRGVKDAAGNRNGNILAGAPVGAVLSNVLSGLKVQAGQLHVFKKKISAPASPVTSDQVIASPRATNILSLLSGNLTLSILYASSIDNMLDVNCDGIGDIIVGEPLSTSIGLLNTNAVGGAAYVYLGQSDGTYVASPYWTLTSVVSPIVGVNATALLGYSVAGAGHVKGTSQGVRALVGGPANSLDFGIGLLNLGNTLGTLLDFAVDNNGLGKAYTFAFNSCGDSDHDGIPDVIDVDDDNDGIPDRYEFAQSQNAYLSPSTDPSADDDGDGIVNYKDVDYGGTLNPMGVCSALDKDGDGIPNHLDLDSDNDGLQDVIEAGGVDANGDGRLDCSGSCDADGDGLLAPVDLNDGVASLYANTDSKLSNGTVPGTTSGRILDTDSDGVPDFLDIDSDNDGIYDLIETGGADADGNGRVDYSGTFASNDADNDGWINSYDADINNDGDVTDANEGTSKALIISATSADGISATWTDGHNPDQFPVDFDADILPNYRDLESDSDGINDVIEAGGADPDGNGIIGSGASSAALVDNDGYASATLTNPLISTDPDTNADGRPDDDGDTYQTPYHNGGGGQPSGFNPDQDGDSRPNFLDLDSDNDGINDIIEYTGSIPAYDADQDGMIDDNIATDTDRDGIAGVVDGAPGTYGDAGDAAPVNTDGIDTNPGAADNDNVPDYLDLDSDNDGVFDSIEGGNPAFDFNKDGIIDCDGNVYTACDPDLDGILEKVDGKPSIIGDAPGVTLPNGPDGDAVPDYRDPDSDDDGTLDVAEKGPGQDKDTDNDGRVDGTDTDWDGIINIPSIDNNNLFGGNFLAGIPLPVHLINFNGVHKENIILLSWLTEEEIQLNRYEIQRSVNGRDFTTIAIVFSNVSSTRNDYVYKDGIVSGKVVYYRLKMVNEDASYSYSSILLFRFDNPGKHIQVYPNPVQTDFTVSLQGMSAGTYRIELINASGQVQFAKQVRVEGSYSEKINRKNSPPGLYMLRIANAKTGQIENFSIVFK